MRTSGALLVLAAASAAAATVASAQTPAVLFPRPFLVEHHVVETARDGSTFTTPAVTDYYGGSWLVSVRADGNRTVVDLARREITEVATAKGTYWTLTFQQMADLRRRLQRAEAPAGVRSQAARASQGAARPAVSVEEIQDRGRESGRAGDSPLVSRPQVRHFRASAGMASPVEAWIDGGFALGAPALAALEAFETEALGALGTTAPGGVAGPGELLSAARRSGGGVAVHTRHAAATRAAEAANAPVLEDVATRLEFAPDFPLKLVVPGEGFRRVPSPLEAMVFFAEDEASRDSSRSMK